MNTYIKITILLISIIISSCSDEFGGKGAGEPYKINIDLTSADRINNGEEKNSVNKFFLSNSNSFADFIPLSMGIAVAVPETEDIDIVYNIIKRGTKDQINDILNQYTHVFGALSSNKMSVTMNFEPGLNYKIIGLGFISENITPGKVPGPDRLMQTELFNPSASYAIASPSVKKLELLNSSKFIPGLSYSEANFFEIYEQFGKLNLRIDFNLSPEYKPDNIKLYTLNSDNSVNLLTDSFNTQDSGSYISYDATFLNLSDNKYEGKNVFILVSCLEGECITEAYEVGSDSIYSLFDELTIELLPSDTYSAPDTLNSPESNQLSFLIKDPLQNLLSLPNQEMLTIYITPDLDCLTNDFSICSGYAETLDSTLLQDNIHTDQNGESAYKFSIDKGPFDEFLVFISYVPFKDFKNKERFIMQGQIYGAFKIETHTTSFYQGNIHELQFDFKVSQTQSGYTSYDEVIIYMFDAEEYGKEIFNMSYSAPIEIGNTDILTVQVSSEITLSSSINLPTFGALFCSDSYCSVKYFSITTPYELPEILTIENFTVTGGIEASAEIKDPYNFFEFPNNGDAFSAELLEVVDFSECYTGLTSYNVNTFFESKHQCYLEIKSVDVSSVFGNQQISVSSPYNLITENGSDHLIKFSYSRDNKYILKINYKIPNTDITKSVIGIINM